MEKRPARKCTEEFKQEMVQLHASGKPANEMLKKLGHIVSRRRIAQIMRYRGLVSAYTVKKYRVHTISVNEDVIPNIVQRQFDRKM